MSVRVCKIEQIKWRLAHSNTCVVCDCVCVSVDYEWMNEFAPCVHTRPMPIPLVYVGDVSTRLNGTFSSPWTISNWACNPFSPLHLSLYLSVAISVYLTSKTNTHYELPRIGNVCIGRMCAYAYRIQMRPTVVSLLVCLLFWRLNGCSTSRL